MGRGPDPSTGTDSGPRGGPPKSDEQRRKDKAASLRAEANAWRNTAEHSRRAGNTNDWSDQIAEAGRLEAEAARVEAGNAPPTPQPVAPAAPPSPSDDTQKYLDALAKQQAPSGSGAAPSTRTPDTPATSPQAPTGGLPANASASQVLAAVGGIESSSYTARNSRTGAYGKYQILPSNWASWAQQAGLPADAPLTPQNQDIVAQHKMAEYVQKYGAQGAMVAWYGGEASAQKWVQNPNDPMFDRAPAQGEPSIREYVNKATNGMAATGSTIGTTSGVGPSVAHPTAASTPDEIEAYIRSNYSDVAPFLANQEIRKIAFDAATSDNPPSFEELQHRIEQTDYWHTHSATSRQFDLLLGTDPTAAVQLIDRAKISVGNQLTQYGVHVDDGQLGEVAKQAIRMGWVDGAGKVSDQQSLTNFTMFALGKQNPGGTFADGTKPAVDVAALRAISKSYYVPMTDQQLAQVASDIETGKQTSDGFKQQMASQSKSLFQNDPDIQSALDAGRTADDYFAPIKTSVAQTLNVTPDSIDLMSPKYSALMQMYDPATKARRAMTLGEAQQWARNQPGFKDTPGYKQSDATFGLNLANLFGAQ